LRCNQDLLGGGGERKLRQPPERKCNPAKKETTSGRLGVVTEKREGGLSFRQKTGISGETEETQELRQEAGGFVGICGVAAELTWGSQEVPSPYGDQRSGEGKLDRKGEGERGIKECRDDNYKGGKRHTFNGKKAETKFVRGKVETLRSKGQVKKEREKIS